MYGHQSKNKHMKKEGYETKETPFPRDMENSPSTYPINKLYKYIHINTIVRHGPHP